VDKITIGDGKAGPITQQISEEFLGIAQGLRPDRFGWLTPVDVNASQPVTA
jgi:branched-chain amino acid aminotransferase